jgi:hypothetical protein
VCVFCVRMCVCVMCVCVMCVCVCVCVGFNLTACTPALQCLVRQCVASRQLCKLQRQRSYANCLNSFALFVTWSVVQSPFLWSSSKLLGTFIILNSSQFHLHLTSHIGGGK